MADEEVTDPKKHLEEGCMPKCVKPLRAYQEPPASRSSKKKKGSLDAQAVTADGDVEARLKAIEECQVEIKGKQTEIDTKLDNIHTILQTILQHLTATPASTTSVDGTPQD